MLTDYCGAGSRLSPERGLELDDARWLWQPKIDGCYARVSLDRRGRIANVVARSGARIREAADLVGIVAGPPDSVLHGELEAHTEAGNRNAEMRGWRALHLFDATRLGGADISKASYAYRYELLAARTVDAVNHWLDDGELKAHDKRTGRYCVRVPRDVRRLPVVPVARSQSEAKEMWREFVEREGGEGLVAVRADAPVQARTAKRKIKSTETLDCRVLSIAGGAARLEHGGRVFVVSAAGKWSSLEPGVLVEVACDGWYEASATPRFARLVRVRCDLPA